MVAVLDPDELVALPDRFGMKVQVDLAGAAAEGVSRELVTARPAHALVGVVEAHATRAEEAARRTGADVADIAEVALMAFAGANCSGEADEWALIEWRTARPAMVPTGPDLGGPFPRQGEIGSGDVLVKTIRSVAAALSGTATAEHAASDPLRGSGVARDAGPALARAMDVLEQAAADAPLHRNVADLMRTTD